MHTTHLPIMRYRQTAILRLQVRTGRACLSKVGRTPGASAAPTALRIWEMGPSAVETLCTAGATACWADWMPPAMALPASVTVLLAVLVTSDTRWSMEGADANVGSASRTGCMFSEAKLRPLISGSAGKPSTPGRAGRFRSLGFLCQHIAQAPGLLHPRPPSLT